MLPEVSQALPCVTGFHSKLTNLFSFCRLPFTGGINVILFLKKIESEEDASKITSTALHTDTTLGPNITYTCKRFCDR